MKKFIVVSLIGICILNGSSYAQSHDTKLSKGGLMHPAPVPYFYVTGLCLGDTTRFISKTDVGTIQWAVTNDKGDTIYQASGDNASYYFKKRGAYNICLTANNGHLSTKIRTVLVDTVTKAGFVYRYCLHVLDNQSACSDQYVWVLPDGSTSTDPFPVFQFTTPGTFPIKLTAKKGNKQNTLATFITVKGDSLGPPSAVFTYRKIGNPAIYEFKAVDSLENNYSWSFGDHTYDDTSGYKVIHAIDQESYTPSVELWVSNGCGFSTYDSDPFSPTGITTLDPSDGDLFIYPNPSNGTFTVDVRSSKVNKEIAITDVIGKMVYQQKIYGKTELNLSFLNKGIYFIRLTDENKRIQTQRILIQ